MDPKTDRPNNPAELPPAMESRKPSRLDSSLGLIAKQFIHLIQSADECCIDINKAATVKFTQILGVPKRRIYDITNVLEGIGVIQKVSKSVSRWVGCHTFTEDLTEESESSRLFNEEQQLDYWIAQLEEGIAQLHSNPAYKNLSYLTVNDIRSLLPPQSETALTIYTGGNTMPESLQVTNSASGSITLEYSSYHTPLSINIVKQSQEEGSTTSEFVSED